MFEFSFELSDRIQKIQQINKDFNLEKNAYVSFSGGKDSTVLSKIMCFRFNQRSVHARIRIERSRASRFGNASRDGYRQSKGSYRS